MQRYSSVHSRYQGVKRLNWRGEKKLAENQITVHVQIMSWTFLVLLCCDFFSYSVYLQINLFKKKVSPHRKVKGSHFFYCKVERKPEIFYPVYCTAIQKTCIFINTVCVHILRVLLYPYVLNVQIHLCTFFFSFSFFYLFPIISMFQTEKEMVCFFINEPECRSFIFPTVFKTLDKCIQNNRFFYKLICLFLTNVTFYDSIIFIFFFYIEFS